MIFASRGFKDPKPWAYALLGGDPKDWPREDAQLTGGFVYLPRTGINPENTILREFRYDGGYHRAQLDKYSTAKYWVDNIITYASEFGVEDLEEVNHAHRVLSRLARLEDDNE